MKVIIVGASGLVGNHLLECLSSNDRIREIVLFVRHKFSVVHPKVTQLLVDFTEMDRVVEVADAVICCIGTTLKAAGSKEAQVKVDLDIPLSLIKFTERNNVPKFMVISSLGTDEKAKGFYLNLKWKMEQAVLNSRIEEVVIVRPSLLYGKRKEFRFGESIAQVFMRVFDKLLFGGLRKYRGIEAYKVANAMEVLLFEKNAKKIIESDELQILGNKKAN